MSTFNISQNQAPIDDDNLIPQPTFCKLLKYHNDTVSMLAFNSNNKQLISSSYDNHVLIWDLANPSKKPQVGEGHKSLINDISIAPTGFTFATASSDHTVRIWSNINDYSSKGKIQSQSIKFNSAPVKSVDFSCDSRLICTGSDDKTVKIISVADKRLQANLTGHTNWVKCTRFNRDSKLIASGSDDKTLKLWDVPRKTLCYSFDKGEHKGAINCVRFHPDNSCLATACFDSKIRLFDVRSKQMVQTYSYHSRPATSLAFHPSGNFLASTSYDETIKIYDLRMGDILFTLQAHSGAVTSIAFSNFGDYFASGGLDSHIVLWESNLEHYKNLGNLCSSGDSESIQSPTSSKPFNSDTKLNYKNKQVVEVNSSNQENTGESLTRLFDKMVSQMEMITSSFVNFERRVAKMEEMIDEINEEDQEIQNN